MSVNTLLENPSSQSKPWCNIYVDKITSYKGAIIKGQLEVNNAGAIGNVLTKTATGTEWLPPAGVQPGNNGQFLKTEGGEVEWKDFDLSSIPRGLHNQVVKTTELDEVRWDYPITPGYDNQVLVSGGGGPEGVRWSSNLLVEGIKFDALNGNELKYYKEGAGDVQYLYDMGYNKSGLTHITYTRVGKIVTMNVTGFTLTMDTGGVVSFIETDLMMLDISLPSEEVTMVISSDMPSVPGRNLAVLKVTPSQMNIYSLSVGNPFPAGDVIINSFTISYICA